MRSKIEQSFRSVLHFGSHDDGVIAVNRTSSVLGIGTLALLGSSTVMATAFALASSRVSLISFTVRSRPLST